MTETLKGTQRADSTLTFNHIFTCENPGKMEDYYDVAMEETLGKGTFGTVYKAKCKSTGVDRAVKAIDLKSVENPASLEREISIAMQLDHPNVVRVYETFRDVGNMYLVQELCTGGELFDHIVDEGKNGFDEYKAAKYIRQILTPLCYLHAQSFAHRDVKPENFLFQSHAPDAALKIIDFGLACQFTADTHMSRKCGTAHYVAPEVLSGRYNEKCDIWSAGVVSFILLCGYPPFSEAGDTDSDIFKKVITGVFEFESPAWDSISQGAKNLVTQMLTSDPTIRPSAKSLLKSPWLAYKGAPKQAPWDKDFVKRLSSFQASSRLKKIASAVVGQQLPDSDIDNLQDILGFLDLDDFMMMMEPAANGSKRKRTS